MYFSHYKCYTHVLPHSVNSKGDSPDCEELCVQKHLYPQGPWRLQATMADNFVDWSLWQWEMAFIQ